MHFQKCNVNLPSDINAEVPPAKPSKSVIDATVKYEDRGNDKAWSCDVSIEKPIPIEIIWTPFEVNGSAAPGIWSEDFPTSSTTRKRFLSPASTPKRVDLIWERAAPALQSSPINVKPAMVDLTSVAVVKLSNPNITYKNKWLSFTTENNMRCG